MKRAKRILSFLLMLLVAISASVLHVSSISVTSSGALEGLGKGVESLIISLCRYAVIIIPTAFVLTRIFGADGVWNAFWIAEAVSAVISAVVYKKAVGNKLNSRRAENNF